MSITTRSPARMRHARSTEYDARPRLCRCGCGDTVLGRAERRHIAKRKRLLASARDHQQQLGLTTVVPCEAGSISAPALGHESTCNVALDAFSVEPAEALSSALRQDSSSRSSGDHQPWIDSDTVPTIDHEVASDGELTPSQKSPSEVPLSGYFSDEDELLEEEYSDRFCIKLLHWKQKSSVSRAAFDDLRDLIHVELGVTLPSLFVMTTVLERHCPLELDTKMVDACPAGCVLFTGRYEDSASCPRCKRARWEEQSAPNVSDRKPTG